ncbi:OmpA family protein [Simiduia agarivorans]|uniref:OmpA family protein n=1 Tax=Simiduia agarivorans (strain DSM 21679 / JCM 13881 / BCRC 17597 / SA1) TaxID=1117647 RepID=K4KP28_SIMAS|nr:OmpA family protein [Simiduia agarivorans]AFV00935.1 OmpA family protein [Simiduia agarivorans SA1 = DSM 21679]
MKKVIATAIALTTLAAASVTPQAQAAEYTELKQGTAFTTGSLVGAIAGGPIGMFVGALAGIYVAEQIEQVDNQEDLTVALAQSQKHAELLSMELAARNETLATQEQLMSQLETLALDKLQLQVMFHTGSDQLTEQGADQIAALANFLANNDDLFIQLKGHTDPRGTDEYNNVLSQYRAKAVQQALEAAGIDGDRIAVSAYGSDQSRARKGDLEAYALERRVDIQILSPARDAVVMGH